MKWTAGLLPSGVVLPSRAPRVVLCCARADAASVQALADDLVRAGHDVAIAADVEPEELTGDLAAHPSAALYVIVQSAALSDDDVSGLVRAFARCRRDTHRLVVLDPETHRAHGERLGEVTRALDTLVARLSCRQSVPSPPATAGAVERGTPRPVLRPIADLRPKTLWPRACEDTPARLGIPRPKVAEPFSPADVSQIAALDDSRRGAIRRRRRAWSGFAMALAVTSGLLVGAYALFERLREPLAVADPQPRVSVAASVVREEAVDLGPAIDAAIAAGRLRALDLELLAQPASAPPKETATGARQYCGALSLDGIGGWSVPEPETLQRLFQARLIPSGRYWADAPPHGAVIFQPAEHRTRRGVARGAEARVVCVRRRGADAVGRP